MFDSPPPVAPSSSTPGSARLAVQPVPAFKDNYLWLIHDGVHAAIVDPGDAAPVLAALAAQRLTLTAILLTHHHADHIGGVPALLAHAAVPVFGPRADGIDAVSHPLGEGDQVEVPGLNLRLRVLDVPGHTLGHIAYVRDAGAVSESGSADAPDHRAAPWLFCGDTLFAGGCGRLFEGTPAQMRASLQKLAALPAATQVFCAHEYTLSNLRFAAAVEPANDAILQRVAAEQAKRDAGLPTLPSTIGLERATNPFLRDSEAAIARTLQMHGKLASGATAQDVFTALREWKNHF